MTEPYTLYGSYASYYTAKVRAYLRKKGIPFVERLPSDPMFRNKVRPASGSHRIPQLLTPEGDVIQDSVAIVDALETKFPDVPAFPPTPLQRTFVHLVELLGSEGLVGLAWRHRWLFPENLPFVIADFGRSFKPQGSDEDLAHYGNLIADRMMSYGLPESTPQIRASLDAQYRSLLALFEAHLTVHPYFLGGHPSAADYAVMGAMHAHMGRDPAGLRTMQDHGPRTFRWMEHMLVPEIQSPEFFSAAIAWPDDDEVPVTSLAILRWMTNNFGEGFVLDVLAFNQAMVRDSPAAGTVLDADNDQPRLPPEIVNHRGSEHQHAASLYAVWLAQRSRAFFHSLGETDRARIHERLGDDRLRDLLTAPLEVRLERVNNRFVVA